MIYSTGSFANEDLSSNTSYEITAPVDFKLILLVTDNVNEFYKVELDKNYDRKNKVNTYSSLSNAISTCAKKGKLENVECVEINLDSLSEDEKELAVSSYEKRVGTKNTKEQAVRNTFFLIKFYYLVSKTYSDCDIKNETQRLECLGKFIEVSE